MILFAHFLILFVAAVLDTIGINIVLRSVPIYDTKKNNKRFVILPVAMAFLTMPFLWFIIRKDFLGDFYYYCWILENLYIAIGIAFQFVWLFAIVFFYCGFVLAYIIDFIAFGCKKIYKAHNDIQNSDTRNAQPKNS